MGSVVRLSRRITPSRMRRQIVLVFAVVSPFAAQAAPNMQEGEWESEIQMKMVVPNLPFAMPPMKFKHTSCLTQKDMVPSTAQKHEECKVLEQKVSGDKVTWKQRCTGKDGVFEADGEMIYNGNSYRGTMHGRSMSNSPNTPATNIEYQMNGRRVGACKK